MRFSLCLLGIALVPPAISTGYAAVVYDEAISGDLSNNRLAPTSITVGLGSNQIFGTTGKATAVDRDYFTITVPTNYQFNSITVLPGTVAGGNVSFIGLEAGSQITLPTSAPNAAGLLGWWHYSQADIGIDILGTYMSSPALGSSGFSVPLGAGDYAFWVQDFNTGTFNYGFDLNISAVPLPGTFWAFCSGFLALLGMGKRKQIFA